MNLVFILFLATVFLSPVPFGLVQNLFQAIFACVFFGLAAVYCMMRMARGRGPVVGLAGIWPESAMFFLVILWAVFQMVSFTPAAWHHPMWEEAAAILQRDVSGGINIAKGGGYASLIRMLSYAAVFWLALQFGRDRQKARLVLWGISAAGTLYAVYGLTMHFGGFGMILWVEQPQVMENVTGTFVNRNNFATYMGLSLLCALGLYLAGFSKALDSRRVGKDRVLHLLHQAFVHGAPLLACILVMLTALFMSNSRGGVISALAALSVMVALLGGKMGLRSRFYRVVAVSLVFVVIGAFVSSGDGWMARLTGTALQHETRLQAFQETWHAIRLAPVSGYGLGSYEVAFSMFADTNTIGFRKAHNDWLEMMFELGIPAAVLWFAVWGGLALRCLAGFQRRRRDHVYPVTGFCACLLVGLHAMVEFSLQIPAVAITTALLLGTGVGGSWRSRPQLKGSALTEGG